MATKPSDPQSIRDELGGLEKLLEHRVRLGICVLLTQSDRLTFQRLKELLRETDGSLGAHLRKLEDAAFISVKKAFRGRRPVTWYTLAGAGRTALADHLSALERLIRQSRLPDGNPRPDGC